MKLPPYIKQEQTRHGKPRWRFRRRQNNQLTQKLLPNPTSDPAAFWAAYTALMGGDQPQQEPVRERHTLAAIADSYLSSAAFQKLGAGTKPMARNRVDRLVKLWGKQGDTKILLRSFDLRACEAIIEKTATTRGPGAADGVRRALSALFEHALRYDLDPEIKSNPIRKIPPPRLGQGAATWTMRDLQTFRDHHAIGTWPRLTLEVIYLSAQRIGDTCRLSLDDVDESSIIELKQGKTGATIFVPIVGAMAAIISATDREGPWIIGSYRGRDQRSPKAAAQWFSKQCTAAGLPNLSAHGLRKARLTHLADTGRSAHELMSISGHTTLSECQRYTKLADRKRLAQALINSESVTPNQS